MNISFGKKWKIAVYVSAKSIGLGICPCCSKINNMWEDCQHCDRCGVKFPIRKPNSIQRTLAWSFAALAMFFPANIYPMMVIFSLGSGDKSTILEGVSLFLQMGMYPVALIIFVASFIIPLGKLCCLFYLVYRAKHPKRKYLVKLTKLYTFIEALGPWSMLDVFVVAIMAAVVNIGFLTSIEAASGTTFFGLMVIFTMFASSSFDIRILWDNAIENNKSE